VVQQRRLIDQSEANDEFKRVSTAKLDALLGLCETAGCRRVRLLSYFGEASEPCGNCDTCLEPPETWDATDAARKALSAIYRTGQRFGAVHLIDVLRGKGGERIARWGHDQLAVFGVGADLDEAAWRSVFRQLVALNLVQVDHEAHGALKLTEASRPVLKGEQQIDLRRVTAQPGTKRARGVATAGPGSPADAGLMERLKTWRTTEARTQSVPPYVIFHDKTLVEIARSRPRDLDELAGISGIGARKLERYGRELLAVLASDRQP
jgi:ATP-dependent DNA helicase RecQ